MTYSLTWLPSVLKAAGLAVVEEPGWETRGHGDVGTTKGVVCFPRNTIILTRRGLISIEEVQNGDEVWTHKNRWKPVIANGLRSAWLVCLRGNGHPGLVTTAEHPFLAYEKVRRREEVCDAHEDGATLVRRKVRSIARTGWIEARDMAQRWWCSPAIFGTENVAPVVSEGLERSVALSVELMWVIGYWLGDGCASFSKKNAHISLYCSLRDIDEVERRVRLAGMACSVQSGASPSVKIVSLSSKPLVRWFEAHFGKLAHGKTVPAWALGMKREWRQALLDGYLLADGGKVKPTEGRADRVDAVTVSKKVAVGIKMLAQSLGVATSLYLRTPPGTKEWTNGRMVTQRPWWTVRLTNSKPLQSHGRFCDGFFVAPCHSVEDLDITGEVFSVSVANDESYVADGIVVHNCHHTAGARSGDTPDLEIVTKGRPDLAGPLAQLVLARSGAFHVIAAGKAWHAGAGLWQGVHDGNSQMIGIEAENTGLANDNPWPAPEMGAYAKGVAAILKHIGASPIMCAGHLEYALPIGRKPDPSFSVGNRSERIKAMVAFRAKVASEMNQPAPMSVAHLPDGTEDAKWLQHSLNDLGTKPPLIVDGHVGPKTAAAIRQFQTGAKIKQTGTADFATLAALHDALGHHEGCACTA